MKRKQILTSVALLFSVLILGFSVNGKDSKNKVFEIQNQRNADGNSKIEVSSASSLMDFNYEIPASQKEFQHNFNPVNIQRRYSLRIENDSRWDINYIYMSSTEQRRWGPDQLGKNTLRSGGSFTLTDIVPGEYDILFVDEDRDRCVLRNVQIFKNTYWTIRSSWLRNCQTGN